MNLVNKNGDVTIQLDLNVKKFKDFAGDAAEKQPLQTEKNVEDAPKSEQIIKV